MIHVLLYGRKDCHLCEVAREELESLQNDIPHELIIIDVDSTDELQSKYGFEVPVIEVGPYTLRAPFEIQELQITLSAAADRQNQIDRLNDPSYRSPAKWTKADAFSWWLSRNYLSLLNVLVLVYLGLPILAPALMNFGATGPARLIYRGYGVVCHQLAFRSFFLFGEQPYYPRQEAQVPNVITFADATGLSEAATSESLYAARAFIGNEQVGYKIALCERDIAIYGAILAFGLLFGITGKRLPAIPWYLWILLGMVPIGLDGVSQLLSQPPFDFWSFRESTPFLRSFTGALFGFFTAWFGYPMVEETMMETRRLLAEKLSRIPRSDTPQ